MVLPNSAHITNIRSIYGDYDVATILYGKFTTFRPSTGAAYTLAGTPSLAVYRDNNKLPAGNTLRIDGVPQ